MIAIQYISEVVNILLNFVLCNICIRILNYVA